MFLKNGGEEHIYRFDQIFWPKCYSQKKKYKHYCKTTHSESTINSINHMSKFIH